MAHTAQRIFFQSVKEQLPQYFTGVKVLDCGSLDVNGKLKDFFTDSDYIGVDITSGPNVDIVSKIHKLELPSQSFDTVVSGEMLEHDEHWKESLQKMYTLCKEGGLIAISCAGEGRAEHGTTRSGDTLYGTSADYYMNLLPSHFREIYKEDMFEDSEVFGMNEDTYFYGIKKINN